MSNAVRTIQTALLIAAASWLMACGGSTAGNDAGDVVATDQTPVDANDVADVTDVTDAAVPHAVQWEPCHELLGAPDDRVECGAVQVPLDWSAPRGERIELFVKRVRARNPSGRSLWMLMGGPGQAGGDGEGLAQAIAARDPGLDIYLPDHRGTGFSTQLQCEREMSPSSVGGWQILQSEWPSCRATVLSQWGDRLRHFTATAAARDLQALIASTRTANEQTYVIGISYGTYLALRYLQIAPTQAAGVVLDSLCPNGTCLLSQQDQWEDETAREILRRCDAEPDCARRMGNDTWGFFTSLMQRMAAGHCQIAETPAASVEAVRTLSGQMMISYALRRLVPAVLYRLDRCNTNDQMVIGTLFNRVFGGGGASAMPTMTTVPLGGGGAPQGYSFPLAINIVASEMWESSNPTAAQLLARWEQTNSCRGVSRNAGWQTENWPRYTDPLASQLPQSNVPMLVLNADLDPATPARLARDFMRNLRAPQQRYVEIPGAAHTVIAQGQLTTDPNSTCGRELLLQFVRDPNATLDTSCTATTLPLGFFVSPTFAQRFFGTMDLWGDP